MEVTWCDWCRTGEFRWLLRIVVSLEWDSFIWPSEKLLHLGDRLHQLYAPNTVGRKINIIASPLRDFVYCAKILYTNENNADA